MITHRPSLATLQRDAYVVSGKMTTPSQKHSIQCRIARTPSQKPSTTLNSNNTTHTTPQQQNPRDTRNWKKEERPQNTGGTKTDTSNPQHTLIHSFLQFASPGNAPATKHQPLLSSHKHQHTATRASYETHFCLPRRSIC